MVGIIRTVPGVTSGFSLMVKSIGSSVRYTDLAVNSESTGILLSAISGMMTRLQSNTCNGTRSQNRLMLVRFMLTSFNLNTILHAEANRLFKYVQFDVVDRLELDAITRHTGFSDHLSVSPGEMPFIRNTEDVN